MPTLNNETKEYIENPPVFGNTVVVEYITLYKTETLWKAIVLENEYGHNKVSIYLWAKEENGWRVIQKYVVKNADEWLKTRSVIDQYVKKGDM